MEQEKSLVLWKLMAMNGAMSLPYYMDDPSETAPTPNSSLSLSRVQQKVLQLRQLETA
jgi:hypothetical protein